MKKLTLAIALFAFVGSASVQAAVIKEEVKTEKAEKADKKAKKSKKSKSCAPGEGDGAKSCCKKKEAKA